MRSLWPQRFCLTLALLCVPAVWAQPPPKPPKTAVEKLPQFKGKSRAQIEKTIASQPGWKQATHSKTTTEYRHEDGSTVRIDAYGNVDATPGQPYTANNAHVHKQVKKPKTPTVHHDDRGKPTTNPDKYHIGIKNPADLPAVRGRPHGQGTPKPESGRATGAHNGH